MQQNRKDGLSFVIRARNEQELLEINLKSLKDISITHEIIVILHKCTDESEKIAEEAKARGQPVVIYKYEIDICRAGFENVIVPKEHPNSLCTYYNWCFSKAQYKWMIKWDADFKATPELISYFNNKLELGCKNNIVIKIPVKLTDTIINTEPYLFNCLINYEKHIFWEVPSFENYESKEITEQIESIPPSVLKAYWKSPPFFINNVDNYLNDRYNRLIKLFGPEPTGLARASWSECDAFYFKFKQNEKPLNFFSIHLYN